LVGGYDLALTQSPAKGWGQEISSFTMAPDRSCDSEGYGTINLARLISDRLDAADPEIYRRITLAVDRIVIDIILRRTRGNQVQASELLGISRTTLRAKLRSLGLAIEKQLSSDSGR